MKTYFGNKFRNYTLKKNPKIFRPTSSPFISGDTLRNEADFIFDETQTFDPSLVKNNDIIFLKTDLKEIYFQSQHPKISSRYILISHNSDKTVDFMAKEFIDEKIIHWFSQNLSFKSDKIFSSIPIGFENRRYLHNGRLNNIKKIDTVEINKDNKILSSHTSSTNSDVRTSLDKIIKELKFVNSQRFGDNFEYLMNLKKHKFILCPHGNGLDTHRVWEGLLTRTVPILEKSDFSLNFYNMGVPIHIVEDWSELKHLDESEINKLYEKFITFEFNKFTKKDFWMDLVYKKKLA